MAKLGAETARCAGWALVAWVVCGFWAIASAAGNAAALGVRPSPEFKVFDGTLFTDKPDLWRHGLVPLTIVYESDLWQEDREREHLPASEAVDAAGRRVKPGEVVCLDVEFWPVRGSEREVVEGVTKYGDLVDRIRRASPPARFGYFGLPPVPDYWRAIHAADTSDAREWRHDNGRLQPLAQKVDVIFPSLYTFYEDRAGWVRFAQAQIAAARAYGKPVYAFLWPQYHESGGALAHRPVPPDYWRLELETVRRLADGLVLWGGWDFDRNRRARWDERAPWWVVTREFLRELRGTPGAMGGGRP